MKKLLLLIAFAILLTIFSCTPDEYETQSTKKIEKITDPLQAADPDGPGDTKVPPPPPPPVS